MITPPKISHLEAQSTALIALKIPKDQIQHVMGPGLGELMSALSAQGVKATGPWFTHHLAITPDSWDFEICFPVGSPVKAAGRVRPGQRPAMKIATTTYQGPYEGLGDAWGEFLGWIEQQGLLSGPDLYECYVTGPESGPDSANWRTEFIKPLLG